jgi:hypothetical protein
MLGKFILWVAAVVFTAYGLVCFFDPSVAAGFAGLAMTNGNAVAEIGAMYGGLQTGIGLFCGLAAMRPEHFRSGLLLLALGIGLLALGRLYSTVINGDPVTAYTWGALMFEVVLASLAGLALRRSASISVA